MDIFAFPPLAALLDAAYGALNGLSTLLEPLAGPSAAALAVVLVTLLVRALLIPVGISQARAEQTGPASPRSCARCSSATGRTRSACSRR